MSDLLLAFGRGVVKTLISVFVGTGVGFLTFGASVEDTQVLWRAYGPPAELFLAIGAGMLSSGAVMFVLFSFPRSRNASPAYLEKGEPVEVA
jgi:hypothetical protein